MVHRVSKYLKPFYNTWKKFEIIDRCRIASPERKRRRIKAQQKRRAVAKLARKPKEKNTAKRRQRLAEAQQRFRERNKKSSRGKFFTASLDVICHVDGYDQLGEDEREVLVYGNCFNDVRHEQLPRYATTNDFFYPPLPNLPELNVLHQRYFYRLLNVSLIGFKIVKNNLDIHG